MRKAGIAVLAALVTVLVAWGALHVLISPVNPAQAAPRDHYDAACWACHLIVESAPLVD